MEDRKLSKDTITTEALKLLNEEGLDGLSLRRLATRLNVKAPSLYWHMPDKNALLASVMELVFLRCLESVPPQANPAKWMRAFGQAVWQTQYDVRDFGKLISAANIDESQLERTASAISARLEKIDMPLSDAVQLQSAVQALMTGWSTYAHVPYSDLLSGLLDMDDLAMKSLDALIDGWAIKP